jgi:hypothetical protein
MEGFEAWISHNKTGLTMLLIPQLNFFPVVKQSFNLGQEVYSNIVIGEQPGELFDAPPDHSLTTPQAAPAQLRD